MSETAHAPRPAWIRSAIDFGALLAFIGSFAFLRITGVDGEEAIIRATWVLMGASVIALIAGWIIQRRIAWLPLIAGSFALVFGGLTVIFHDSSFMKLKITIQNGILATALLGSVLIGKNLGKLLLGQALPLPDEAWRTLTIRYGLFFAACAIANEIVWRTQSNDFWVAFRGGMQIASLVFAFANVPLIMKYMAADEETKTPEPPDPGL